MDRPGQGRGHRRLGDGELRLKQRFQMLEGTLRQGGQEMAIGEARMNGTQIAFTAGDRQFTGTVEGGRMAGTSRTPQGSQARSAARSAPRGRARLLLRKGNGRSSAPHCRRPGRALHKARAAGPWRNW